MNNQDNNHNPALKAYQGLMDAGQIHEPMVLLRRFIKDMGGVLADEHPDGLEALMMLSACYEAANDYDMAYFCLTMVPLSKMTNEARGRLYRVTSKVFSD